MYVERLKYVIQSSVRKTSLYRRIFFVLCGAMLVAVSLELFLVRNSVIDGGIVGVSLILSHLSSFEAGPLLLLLNSPFLLVGYQYMGRRFVFLSMLAIFALWSGMFLLKPYPVLTTNPFVVIGVGGTILGLGIGLIIRYGGALDGTEILAILLSKRTRFSIGQYVMIFNFIIFGSSIFVFGIREAFYSLVTYFIAYNIIDLSVQDQ
ncbi:YitT family protein [Bacillus sp. JZ8]